MAIDSYSHLITAIIFCKICPSASTVDSIKNIRPGSLSSEREINRPIPKSAPQSQSSRIDLKGRKRSTKKYRNRSRADHAKG